VYLVAKAEQERQAAVIRAEGEAEAAELISAALKGSGVGLIEVRSSCIYVLALALLKLVRYV
jgi:regulator of protease activity HflC (stomatin/prohibitin superfamily)